MAETTSILDEAAFSAMQRAYREHSQNPIHAVTSNFLRYLITEDQTYCHVPDHESYMGQIKLLGKIEATAHRLEST